MLQRNSESVRIADAPLPKTLETNSRWLRKFGHLNIYTKLLNTDSTQLIKFLHNTFYISKISSKFAIRLDPEQQPAAAAASESDITTNWDEAVESFDAMNLHDNLLRGIYAYGFEKPSAIQQRAIKPMSLGRDIIAQAQSGTGKTATFAVGILQMLDPAVTDCQALVLAPTRELAQQIVKVGVCPALTSRI